MCGAETPARGMLHEATHNLLTLADETLYLRSASINIFNGMLSLTFSCDGSHYIPVQQFLARDSAFWEGIN